MKWNRVFVAALAAAGVIALGGCTDESTRAVLTVVEVNGGQTYFSDLVAVADTILVTPADEVTVKFGNIPNDGGPALAPGAPFSEIVVTGYTVTYDNGVYSPVTGGMNVRVPSGGATEATIALSDIAQKAALPNTFATSTIARITFSGYNRINGSSNGDLVSARANLTVQVADFADDVND